MTSDWMQLSFPLKAYASFISTSPVLSSLWSKWRRPLFWQMIAGLRVICCFRDQFSRQPHILFQRIKQRKGQARWRRAWGFDQWSRSFCVSSDSTLIIIVSDLHWESPITAIVDCQVNVQGRYFGHQIWLRLVDNECSTVVRGKRRDEQCGSVEQCRALDKVLSIETVHFIIYGSTRRLSGSARQLWTILLQTFTWDPSNESLGIVYKPDHCGIYVFDKEIYRIVLY